MNPQTRQKLLTVLIAAGIPAAFTFLTSLERTLTPNSIAAIVCGALLAGLLAYRPALSSQTVEKDVEETVEKQVVSKLPKIPPLPVLFMALLGLILAACNPNGTPKPQTVQDLKTVEATLLDDLPVACTIADAIDPAQMTAICAVVDTADTLLTAAHVVQTSSPAAAAALVAAHPASPAVVAKLTHIAAMRQSKVSS
jgi:hypothetical protein